MEELIERLRRASIGATFNFYRDGDGADARCHRLHAYLEARENAPLLLVGEAAGHRGARVSGIPFTSERQLTGRGPPRRRPRSSAARSPSSAWRTRRSAGTSSRRTPTARRAAHEPAADTRRDRRVALVPRRARSNSPCDPGRARGRTGARRAGCQAPVPRRCAGVPRRPAKIARMNDYPVVRNTILLAGSLTCLSGMLQLGVAVATTSLVLVTGSRGSSASARRSSCWPAPSARCRPVAAWIAFGRIPVLAGGFALGIVGCLVTALACGIDSAVLLVTGFAAIGGSQGIALLARTAAGDMYPPERRARGILLVLFGAVFGAILVRPSSARCSRAVSSTRMRWSCPGWRRPGSWSAA